MNIKKRLPFVQRELIPKAAEGLFYRKYNLYNPSVRLTHATSLYTREAVIDWHFNVFR